MPSARAEVAESPTWFKARFPQREARSKSSGWSLKTHKSTKMRRVRRPRRTDSPQANNLLEFYKQSIPYKSETAGASPRPTLNTAKYIISALGRCGHRPLQIEKNKTVGTALATVRKKLIPTERRGRRSLQKTKCIT